MAEDHVVAPHRIVDHDLGRVVYGTGERVPIGDAIKYGLISAPAKKAPAKKAAGKGKRGPTEDRARRPVEDR